MTGLECSHFRFWKTSIGLPSRNDIVDVPMSRVKFNVNTEYAYLQNFKVLQSTLYISSIPCPKLEIEPMWHQPSHPSLTFTLSDTFTKHQIDRPMHVEQLVKCRMQDNLEFLQWTKRYWDQYYPGGDYDAHARRKASGGPSANPRAGATSAGARRGTTPTTGGGPRARLGNTGGGGGGGANTAALTREIETQKEAITGLEKERDFYFAKLRDIELLLQTAVEADPELEKENDSLIKHIQAILYSTEV